MVRESLVNPVFKSWRSSSSLPLSGPSWATFPCAVHHQVPSYQLGCLTICLTICYHVGEASLEAWFSGPGSLVVSEGSQGIGLTILYFTYTDLGVPSYWASSLGLEGQCLDISLATYTCHRTGRMGMAYVGHLPSCWHIYVSISHPDTTRLTGHQQHAGLCQPH